MLVVQVVELIKRRSSQCQASGSHLAKARAWKTVPAMLHRGDDAVLLAQPDGQQSYVQAPDAMRLWLSQLICQQMN